MIFQKTHTHRLPGARQLGASLVVVALSLLGGLVACSRAEHAAPSVSSASSVTPGRTAVDALTSGTLAPDTKAAAQSWLLDLRRVHARADDAKTPEERRAALEEMRGAFEASAGISRKLGVEPGVGVDGAPGLGAASEVVSLSQDLASRAARIELGLGDGPSALAWAERGLGLSSAPSVLRANLLLDAADAHKLSGQPALARTFLLEALSINQRLLDEELDTP